MKISYTFRKQVPNREALNKFVKNFRWSNINNLPCFRRNRKMKDGELQFLLGPLSNHNAESESCNNQAPL